MDNGFSKKKKYIVLASVLLIVVGVLAVFIINELLNDNNRDPNASVGHYEGSTADLDKIVEEGMFNVSINPTVIMKRGGDDAELRIENIAANHHLMSVRITLDNTGKTIYQSGLIDPGYYIESVPLKVKLAKGTYAATAEFTAYDEKTEDEAGTAAVKITIMVKK